MPRYGRYKRAGSSTPCQASAKIMLRLYYNDATHAVDIPLIRQILALDHIPAELFHKCCIRHKRVGKQMLTRWSNPSSFRLISQPGLRCTGAHADRILYLIADEILRQEDVL